ncbi:hypothetical protein [Stigmatella erecta]|uniref:Uncharacterized protein n=1 Tax=Stigmatella erecta TaxID=83460 RepID=A0A1I0KLH6_9BACT|nr:hypothetical protein [Stigmatella erecta]SEU25817.1 hypothetical protein SAMN05443639_1121 [Stigmatella erecta]
MSRLPPCGLYRTRQALGSHIPEGRLVYFHNHGDPGPGLYLPSGWNQNRAQWHARGTTLPAPEWAEHLEPLLNEGFYRVRESFFCCEKRCQTFEEDQLVQLGYNGAAEPILFIPQWGASGLAFPTSGTLVERKRLDRLTALKVSLATEDGSGGPAPFH